MFGIRLDITGDGFVQFHLRPFAMKTRYAGFVTCFHEAQYSGIGHWFEMDGSAGFDMKTFIDILVLNIGLEWTRHYDCHPSCGCPGLSAQISVLGLGSMRQHPNHGCAAVGLSVNCGGCTQGQRVG